MAKKKKDTSKADALAAVKRADRQRDLDAYGNLYRSGGRRVWTARNGRADASRKACRGGAWA
jgi:hypothetical protein